MVSEVPKSTYPLVEPVALLSITRRYLSTPVSGTNDPTYASDSPDANFE